jgi:TRAP-type C4-dicarboxylate transport system permease small subunit
MTDVPLRSGSWQVRGPRAIALFGLMALMAVAGTTVVDILLRWAKVPVEGVFDLGQMLMLLVIGCCFPATTAGEHNLAVRVVGSLVRARLRALLEAFGAVLLLVALAILAWKAVEFAAGQWSLGIATQHLRMPTAPWWAVCAAMVGLSVPIQAAVLVRHLRRTVDPTARGVAGDRRDHA